MSDAPAEVTAVLPVRNGASTIAGVIENLLGQSHRALEVVVVDNASTDETADVVTRLLATSPRLRYLRHPRPLTAIGNFEAAYRLVRTPYFLWAAHDDLRSADFVERLLQDLERAPEAILAFGDLAIFDREGDPSSAQPFPYDCDTRGLSFPQRLRFGRTSRCVELYGLWRTNAVRQYPWYDLEQAADMPLVTYAACAGEIVHVRGPVFYQYRPAEPKTRAARAVSTGHGRLRRWPTLRLGQAVAGAAAAGTRLRGTPRTAIESFVRVYPPLATRMWKARLFEASPAALRGTYRRLRRMLR